MSVDEGEVRRIAELARLELDEEEVAGYARDLEAILAHFEALGELGLEGDGAPQGRGLDARLRADVPSPDALAHGPEATAPRWRDGYFLVPRLPAMERDEG